MDWKYALPLPLDKSGRQPVSLCRFRRHLDNLTGNWENLDPEAQEIIETVCETACMATRLDAVFQAFNQTLESLAALQPEWLRAIALPHWYKRYDGYGFSVPLPPSEDELKALARKLGSDTRYLLAAVQDLDHQSQGMIPEIHRLRRVFHDQFEIADPDAGVEVEINWKPKRCATCILIENDPSQQIHPRR